MEKGSLGASYMAASRKLFGVYVRAPDLGNSKEAVFLVWFREGHDALEAHMVDECTGPIWHYMVLAGDIYIPESYVM